MPIEAELKARVRDAESVRDHLRRLSSEEVSTYHDTYYDWPGGLLTRRGQELRIRVIENAGRLQAVLTYKDPAVDAVSGSKPEDETTVGQGGVLDVVFTELGLVHLVTFEKRCVNYAFTAHGREIRATLVTVSELDGTFVEVETLVNEQSDVAAALNVIRSVLADLDVSEDDVTTEQYTDAVLARRGLF